MAALIISRLLPILIIIFFSAVSSSAPPLNLPVYHFPDSQLYQVRLSNNAFVPVDTGNDVALFRCTAKSPLIRTVTCNKTDMPLCKMVQPTGCAGGCVFKREYSGSKVTAILVQGDIPLLRRVPGDNFTYGCVNKSSDSFQGLLSLGRGPLSLLNQTTKSYRNVFSYCFSSYNDDTKNGFLMLGQKKPRPRGLPLYTKLHQSIKRPILYYVGLEAIFVDQTRLTGFPVFDTATGAGTVFDTGVMFTSLVPRLYKNVRDVVRGKMLAQYGNNNPRFVKNQFDTCYNISINVRSITFMFTNSHNLTLPPPNFIVQIGRSFCLAMTPSSRTNYNLNIIASFQQQYKGITIDVTNSKLTINDNMKRNCNNINK